MLYYYQDKPLSSPFGKILEGVESFLNLCHPGTREIQRVFVNRWPGGDKSRQEELRAINDGSSKSKRECERLYTQACNLWNDADYAIYLAWKPTVGPKKLNPIPESLGHQVTITQCEPGSRRSWAFVYLPTSFEKPDASFLSWLELANATLPFRLQESRWRFVNFSKSGTPVLRKAKWSA